MELNNSSVCIAAATLVALGINYAFGGVPEPPHLLYGIISRFDGQVAPAEDVTSVARINALGGQIVGEYEMGARPEIGDYYYLPIALQSLADGRSQSSDASLLGQTVSIYVRHGESTATERLATFSGGQPAQFVLTEVGAVENRDLFIDCCCNTFGDGNCCALFADVAAGAGMPRPGSNCSVDLNDIICELDGYAAGSNWVSACPNGDIVGTGATSCGGNGRIDLFDIFASLNAFPQGSIPPCPVPCPQANACDQPASPSAPRSVTSSMNIAAPNSMPEAKLFANTRKPTSEPGGTALLDVYLQSDKPVRGYQISLLPADSSLATLRELTIDKEQPSFVFQGKNSVQAQDLLGSRATSALFAGTASSSERTYLGTFEFELSPAAKGSVRFEFNSAHCLLVGTDGATIPVDTSEPVVLRIARPNPHSPAAVPTSEAKE